jgi:hypothetical protein
MRVLWKGSCRITRKMKHQLLLLLLLLVVVGEELPAQG